MTRVPDFDELVGTDVPADERDRLRRTHELLVQAGPPAELSPELEAVPWPEESQSPLVVNRKPRRRLLIAAAIATFVAVGFVIGQATTPSSTSLDVERVIRLAGTDLDSNASADLELGKADANGNWPMVLRVRGLDRLAKGGYYDLYLTKGGKPVVLCGTFNATSGVAEIRMNAAYDLSHFDRNGWVVTRQPPGHHEPDQIVLKPAPGVA
jgi:hypothetical protein